MAEETIKDDGCEFIKLANSVSDYYKSFMCKSKIRPHDSWIVIQKLSEATYSESCDLGFNGTIVDWIDLIGVCLNDRDY